jgi:hypothetical protein
MQSFSRSVESAGVCEDLLSAIHGAGAFRNFKDTVRRLGIESASFAFRAHAFWADRTRQVRRESDSLAVEEMRRYGVPAHVPRAGAGNRGLLDVSVEAIRHPRYFTVRRIGEITYFCSGGQDRLPIRWRSRFSLDAQTTESDSGSAIGAASMALALSRWPSHRRAGQWMFASVARPDRLLFRTPSRGPPLDNAFASEIPSRSSSQYRG